MDKDELTKQAIAIEHVLDTPLGRVLERMGPLVQNRNDRVDSIKDDIAAFVNERIEQEIWTGEDTLLAMVLIIIGDEFDALRTTLGLELIPHVTVSLGEKIKVRRRRK